MAEGGWETKKNGSDEEACRLVGWFHLCCSGRNTVKVP